jgi:hypothetical protein
LLDLIPPRYRVAGAWQSELEQSLGSVRLLAVPIAHDCIDGYYGAFWRHPSAYLDLSVRAGISMRVPQRSGGRCGDRQIHEFRREIFANQPPEHSGGFTAEGLCWISRDALV